MNLFPQGLRTALIIMAIIWVASFPRLLFGDFLGFEMLLHVPLRGIVVRFRTNYRPKESLVTDSEEGVEPQVESYEGPVVTSLVAMSRRVYEVEGWSGFYKGLMPNLVTRGVILFSIANFLARDSPVHKYLTPVMGFNIHGLIYDLVVTIVCLPLLIITNRAMTTPYKLPWFKPMTALHVLFTPSERQRPWSLATLGVFIPQLMMLRCSRTIVPLIFELVGKDPITKLKPEELWNHKLHVAILLSIEFGALLLCAAALCPLEVISTRLSVQKIQSTGAIMLPPEEEEETLRYALNGSKDVVRLRTENPYSGFFNCAITMVREEGFWSLLRGWWIVALVLVSGSRV